jgi:hypothetical protein
MKKPFGVPKEELAETKRQAIQAAHAKLPASQQAAVDRATMKIVNGVKNTAPNQPFGPAMALEILGSIAMLLADGTE